MDVIIFGGQSNMQGQTEGLPTENAPVEGAREYRFLTDELKPLAHPVGEDVCFEKWLAAAHEGGGSLVPAFCRAYVKATGREVVAIHAAKGSTTLAEWQRGTQHFYHAERKILAGLRKARETGTVDRVYYVWLQGESDAMIYTTEEEYYEGLLRYKNTVKAEFGVEKFGIIRVGYFVCNAPWLEDEGSVEVRALRDEAIMRAQERAAETDGDFAMLTRLTKTLSRDPEYINPRACGHYNNKAMELLGAAAGEALAKL